MKNWTVYVALLLAGCGPTVPPDQAKLGSAGGAADAATVQADASKGNCEDPYPCGNEWPKDLEGPFQLQSLERVQVTSLDGTVLDGWIARPSVPEGVKTPTILVSSPYFDGLFQAALVRDPEQQPGGVHTGTPAGGLSSWWEDPAPGGATFANGIGVAPIRLIRHGYSLAYFSVRGTGSSGGCFENGGPHEQEDQKVLVDWIAAQSWSNGRVGMNGISYPSATTWQAAVQAPKALKAVITGGDAIDMYLFGYSPQGARSLVMDEYLAAYETQVEATSGTVSGRTTFLGHETCTGQEEFAAQEAESLVSGYRNPMYWEQRSLSRRLASVKAAVLDTGGYLDYTGQYMQDSAIWGSLPASTPRVQYEGWWGHTVPAATRLNMPSGEQQWDDVVIGWYDYWLKGIGPAPRTGVVYHQDQNLAWHESGNWSPEPKKKEVLYLADTGLATQASAATTTFHSVPPPADALIGLREGGNVTGATLEQDGSYFEGTVCPDTLGLNLSHVYMTPAATADALIAGNPFLYVTVSSDMDGGMVSATLLDISPDFTCKQIQPGLPPAPVDTPYASGIRWIASGSADLNFYASPFVTQHFAVNTPTDVRIDLSDITYSIAAGHRLALVLSHGEIYERAGTTVFPNITIGGASQLVLPVMEGTFGGKHPTQVYPQRPFTPPGYED